MTFRNATDNHKLKNAGFKNVALVNNLTIQYSRQDFQYHRMFVIVAGKTNKHVKNTLGLCNNILILYFIFNQYFITVKNNYILCLMLIINVKRLIKLKTVCPCKDNMAV